MVFTKFCLGEGAPRPHPPAKFSRCSFKNVALRLQKSPKMVIFLVKIATQEKFWGSIGKLERRCTNTTINLPVCNDTIIVLKLILLHSVSVITNFVIPKRDKKTDRQKKTSHFFVYSRHVWSRRRSVPFLYLLTFLMRSVFSPIGTIESLRKNTINAGKCL